MLCPLFHLVYSTDLEHDAEIVFNELSDCNYETVKNLYYKHLK